MSFFKIQIEICLKADIKAKDPKPFFRDFCLLDAIFISEMGVSYAVGVIKSNQLIFS